LGPDRQRSGLSVDSECAGSVLGHEINLIARAEAALMAKGNTSPAWRGDDGPPGSETRSWAQGNHGNLRSPANRSLKVRGGLARRGKTGGGKLGRQDDGSRRSTADGDEGDESTEGGPRLVRNPDEKREDRTRGRAYLPDHLVRVNDAAKRSRQTRFTALLHHVDVEALERAFRRLRGKAAPRGGRDDGRNLRRKAR
jgi:hypothetical protein